MTRLLVAATTVALLLPGAAGAAQADGSTCGMVAAWTDDHVAVVWSGPVRANAMTDTIAVTCSIQVGHAFHGGPVAASMTVSGVGVTPPAAEEKHYDYPGDLEVYLCTRWTVNGVAYYYDAPSGSFTTGTGAECDRAFRQNLDEVSPLCLSLPPLPSLCVNLHNIVDEAHVVTPKPASADTTR